MRICNFICCFCLLLSTTVTILVSKLVLNLNSNLELLFCKLKETIEMVKYREATRAKVTNFKTTTTTNQFESTSTSTRNSSINSALSLVFGIPEAVDIIIVLLLPPFVFVCRGKVELRLLLLFAAGMDREKDNLLTEDNYLFHTFDFVSLAGKN